MQIKGREVNAFRKYDCCHFRITRDELVAYSRESGVIFFVVEILKKPSPETKKVFWKQLLPYDIDFLFKKMGKNAIPIELNSLENNNLTHVCQNFIRDRDKQKHGKVKTLGEIKGLDGFSFSAITEHFGTGNKALNDYIVAGNPLYLYAQAPNDISFPIANLLDDNVRVVLHDTSEVWVDEVSYGDHYFSHQINKNGYYFQFGLSWRFLQEGQAKFSAAGTLDDRIKDVGFLLKVIEGGKIRIGHYDFPFNPQNLSDQSDSIQNIVQCFKILQEVKSVFDFLGMISPIDITGFGKRDFHILEKLSEHVVHGKECPSFFKDDGFNVLRIGKYHFLVLVHQKRIINVFCRGYYETVRAVIRMVDGTQERISPYHSLNSEAITKMSNFDGNVVMESIEEFPYSLLRGWWYNQLLIEAIKAMDVAPNNTHVVKFANDLAGYLLENEDSVIHRLNKMQIHKRFAPLEKQEVNWLLVERDRQDDSRMLCGIAILLDDTALFDEHFTNLTPDIQAEFQTYPIMKLLGRG